MQKYKLLLI